MFVDAIASLALRQPHRTAVCLPTADISYRDFDNNINQVANKLRGDLAPGSRVAVMVDNLYLHWLLLLALARLGHVSASLDPGKQDQMLDVIGPSAVFSDRAVTSERHARNAIRVSADWLKETLVSQPATAIADTPPLTAPVRIVTSSGTTGTPKKILFTRADLVKRMQGGGLQIYSLRQLERQLPLLGLDTFGGYSAALRTWWFGGAVCLFGGKPERIAARQVTGLLASPTQLKRLLARIPADFSPPPGLSILCGGSRTPRDVALLARVRLTPDIAVAYGSTEAGAVAVAPIQLLDRDPELTGITIAGVDLQVVDDDSRPLPFGELGEIRIRTLEMATGYLDDENATARHFRDGWFYPGDLGTLFATGELRVLGRANDVLNAGGVKVAPDAIEEALLAAPGIADAGVFSTQNDAGGVHLWAAIVENGPVDEAALQAVARQRMASGNTPLRFVSVDSIPRNAMGKIERFKLRDAVPMPQPATALSA